MDTNKKLLLKAYIAGSEAESHWSLKWKELPWIGRYRRIKKFIQFYNESMLPTMDDSIMLVLSKYTEEQQAEMYKDFMAKKALSKDIPRIIQVNK